MTLEAVFGTDEYARDPGGQLREMREAGPVHRVTVPGYPPLYLVTRYQEVRGLFTDDRLRKDPSRLAPGDRHHGPEDIYVVGRQLLSTDDGDHQRLRRLLTGWWSRAASASWPEIIERHTRELLDELAAVPAGIDPARTGTAGTGLLTTAQTGTGPARTDPARSGGAAGTGETDLVAGFTRPLPLRILADILGVPQAEVPVLQELLHVVTGNAAPDSPALRAAQADLAGVWFRLAREHVDDDSLLGMLARARQQREISLVEMTSLLTMLLVAGAHSMSMLLPRSVLFLSGAPQLAATLAGDDEAAQDAVVEELIRLCAPFPLASHRYTTHDVDLWGTPVPAGSLVLPALSAANRDPRVYSAPERACPGRPGTEPKHLSFGHGAHYCLGAVLARKQARIALVRLYQRFPRLSVAGVPAWRNHVVPEPTSLPVRLAPAST